MKVKNRTRVVVCILFSKGKINFILNLLRISSSGASQSKNKIKKTLILAFEEIPYTLEIMKYKKNIAAHMTITYFLNFFRTNPEPDKFLHFDTEKISNDSPDGKWF